MYGKCCDSCGSCDQTNDGRRKNREWPQIFPPARIRTGSGLGTFEKETLGPLGKSGEGGTNVMFRLYL